MLQSLGRDWDRYMKEELLKIEVPIMEAFEKAWTAYVEGLNQVISTELPVLESFSIDDMSNAKKPFTTSVREILEWLSTETSTVGFDLVDYLEEELKQTFEGAFKIGKLTHIYYKTTCANNADRHESWNWISR